MEDRVPKVQENRVEAFGDKHRTSVVTLLFTDIVGSTALKQQLGDKAGSAFFDKHHQLVRKALQAFSGSQEIETAGDSFLITFATPSDAVKFALLLQPLLRALSKEHHVSARERIGIHLGEVVIKEHQSQAKPRDLYGIQIDACARVMALAKAGQMLMTRAVFDSARQVLKGEDIEGVGQLEWLNHGPYLLKGLDEPLEICEVREAGQAETPGPPTTSEKAQRQARPDEEPILGWRPAVGQLVPNTRWLLEKKLGEGGFGEVWLGRHTATKQTSVFKFCFRAERVRFLKRELTLFRILKERVGGHPNIVGIHDVYLDQPPYYVEMEYAEGKDLRSWWDERGGLVGLETRLEIAAQAADALQAAHDAGIIHRDVKPANILIGGKGAGPAEVRVKITDFGIGQVVSEECLQGITRAGFTQTLVGSSSSSHTGTQMYMAPELLAGKPASTRSDTYSLGVVLYQLLVGDFTRPLTTDWASDISDPLLREDLQHCFAGNPLERFPGVAQLAKNLRALSERQSALAKQIRERAERERAAYRRGLFRSGAVAALIVAAIALLAGYGFRQAKRADRSAHRAEDLRQRAEAAAVLLRRNGYAADMNVAHHALREGNLGRVQDLVAKHLPQPGQEDLRGFEWCYLWEQSRGDALGSFPAHDSAATSVAFAPNGEVLASGSFDRSIRLWNVRSGTQVRVFGPFSDPVGRNALTFSPAGLFSPQPVARRSSCGKRRPGKKCVDGRVLSAHPLAIPTPSPSRLMAKFIAGKTPGGVTLWDIDSGATRLIRSDSRAFGNFLAYASDEVLAIVDGQSIGLWNTQTLTRQAAHEVKTGPLVGLATAPTSSLIAGVGVDGVLTVWSWAAPSRTASVKAHTRFAFAVAFSPGGKTLATGGADQLIHLWDPAAILATTAMKDSLQSESTLKPLGTLRGHGNQVWGLAFSPDGQRLVSASKDGELKVWDAEPHSTKEGLDGAKRPLWFAPDGRVLLTVNRDNRLHLWDLAVGVDNLLAEIPTEDAKFITVSPDGSRLAFTKPGGEIQLWDLTRRQRIRSSVASRGAILGLAFSADGHLLAVADGQATTLWNLLTDRVQSSIAAARGVAIGLSPDGTRLAVYGTRADQSTIEVWDLAASKLQVTLSGHTINVGSLAFSRNGQLLASGGHDNTVRLWDPRTGRARPVLRGHLTAVTAVAFSADDKTLATGGSDGTVKLWHVQTGQELFSEQVFPGPVTSLMFSPAGDALAIGTSNGEPFDMRLWRVKSLTAIDTAQQVQPIR